MSALSCVGRSPLATLRFDATPYPSRSLFKASGFPEGDTNDPATGFSPYPGNINQLVLRVHPYAEVLAKSGVSGDVEVHGLKAVIPERGSRRGEKTRKPALLLWRFCCCPSFSLPRCHL